MSNSNDSDSTFFGKHRNKFLLTFLALFTTAGLVAWLARTPTPKTPELDDSQTDEYEFNPAV